MKQTIKDDFCFEGFVGRGDVPQFLIVLEALSVCGEYLCLNKIDENVIEEIWQNFGGLQHVFLATVDDDQPRLRPVTLFRLGDKLFVATGSSDAKAKQIRQNPKAEFCLFLEKKDGNHGSIRVECIANIVKDMNVKTEAYNKVSFMKEFWSSPEDQRYLLIELQPTGYEYLRPGSIEAIKIRP